MKKIFFTLLILSSLTGFSQSSLNDYNMAVIPAKYEFQKVDNEYRINTTIKSFLKQKGFEAYLSSDQIPEGFMDYNCNKLFVNVVEESSMFFTKIQVEFKDCKNKVLFATDLAESRSKDRTKSYNEALLLALKSFDKAKYKYSGKTYFDEEAQEKLKVRDVENVTLQVVKTEKNESFIRVVNQMNQKELILYKTSKPNIYLSSYNGRNGIVFSKENVWVFEYIDGDKTTSEPLEIKL
ncbi:hypothetical protein NAT51_06665 [Flavobacterium amniphilum]|uniref:hypothetical protein n=1 Tax=Flavobacterium amniphilum TaxID=1834035 RepID=UPI00202AA5CA|nr:hypothetical protein [Flavobacterium amniphilum]MCL9805194.1 hypothetical protein [Flavobacterium amniphilum]